MPRAAASPIRTPVNDPGPTVTATAPRSANVRPASAITRRIIGKRTSACPLANGRYSRARTPDPSTTAAEHAAADESIPRTTGMVLVRRSDMPPRSEEHTSELQSLMRISYAVFCLKKKHTEKQYKPQSIHLD